MKIETPFNIGDKVMILPLDLLGRIEIIQITTQGIEYKVVYFSNSEQRQAWLMDYELERQSK